MDSSSIRLQDADAIFTLSERLTGNSSRNNLTLVNVARRMQITGHDTLFEYLRFTENTPEEMPHLISSLLVHTTSWFREESHMTGLVAWLEDNKGRFNAQRPLRILSAACSTGEEVWTLGLVLEAHRQVNPGFEYSIEGRDIDVLCVNRAAKAVYPAREMEKIPERYRNFLLEGSGRTQGLFTLSAEIRHRCRFSTWNLLRIPAVSDSDARFDWVFCRNVLIYFTPSLAERVIGALLGWLGQEGVLCVGHVESIDHGKLRLRAMGHSLYHRIRVEPPRPPQMRGSEPPPPPNVAERAARSGKIRVLIIEDSASVRAIIGRMLEADDFTVFFAESAEKASEFLSANSVDLVTLDLTLPGIDGRTWLNQQRNLGMELPVVIISEDYPSEAISVFGALEGGAQDYFHKGQVLSHRGEILERFRELVRSQRDRKVMSSSPIALGDRLRLRRPDLVLVGASIGGPDALQRLLHEVGPESPPLIVVQHISPHFAKPFAERLAGVAGVRMPEPIDGIVLEKGCLYMIDGDRHIGVRRADKDYILTVSDEQPLGGHRPSVDFLFRSGAAMGNAENVFAVILTGMGTDGAKGMADLKRAGAMTFAQGPETSVVYGMAKEAVRLGGVDYVGDVADIRFQLELALQGFETLYSVAGQSIRGSAGAPVI